MSRTKAVILILVAYFHADHNGLMRCNKSCPHSITSSAAVWDPVFEEEAQHRPRSVA
jgi:hypothetical protein